MIILLITLLGLFLRLVLANQSLWLDEAASVVIASLPVKTLIQSLAGDFHPPLYYLSLKPWLNLAGQNELLLRLPGIIVGTLTIPALYYLVKLIFVPKKPIRLEIAHLAALLLALNPLHIYYSQELRMYAFSAFLAVLTWYFLIKKNFFTYTILTILSFYTFYLSIFILVSQWFYVFGLYKKRYSPKATAFLRFARSFARAQDDGRRELRLFILSNLLFAISLLPWLPTLFNQLKGGGYLTQALPGWSALSGSLSIKSLVLIPTKFSLGRISILPKNLYYLVVGLVLSFLSLLLVFTLRVKRSRVFLLWFFIPLGLALAVSFFTPILGYWRYIFLLPAFSVLLAVGIASLPKKVLIINLSLLILLFLSSQLYFFSNPRFHRENWSSLAELVSKKQDTLILVNFTDAFAPLKFYLPQTPVFPTQVQLGQIRPDLDQELPFLINQDTTVYYLDYLSDLTSPDRPILTWLERAGLKRKITYQFNGLGAVYEYQAR